jgi:hypothetical protein
VDERVELDQLPRLPAQPVELRLVVAWAEPGVEDEVLRRRDRRNGVDLQEPEASDRVEYALRGSGEKLRSDGDPARLFL